MEEKASKKKFEKLGKVFNFFAKYVEEEGGMVKTDQSALGDLEIVVLVDSIDFYKGYMTEFIECLPMIDELHITNTGDDSIEIRVTAKDEEVSDE